MKKNILSIFAIAIILWMTSISTGAAKTRQIHLGYFEGGPNSVHQLLREEYLKQLQQMLPDSVEVVFTPTGFYSAEWKRENIKTMAAEINHNRDVDMVVAVGPWVVEALIEVGYKKPIIAMYQFDPKLTHLLNSDNQPKVSNLTILWNPNKIKQDLNLLSRLTDRRKLGWLYFPSDSESVDVFNYVRAIAAELGFELFTAEEFDNYNSFAFFKAYNALDKKVDIVYIAPLWGMDGQKISAFFDNLNRAQKPGFTYDGSLVLEKGALATSNYYQVVSSARFYAHNSLKIIEGAIPSELPVLFSGGSILAINEKTAQQSGIEFPDRLSKKYFTIEAPLSAEIDRYNLSDALYRAMTQNPGYLSTTFETEAAGFEVDKNKAVFYPHLSADAYYRYLDKNIVHNSYHYLTNDQLGATVSLDQKLFSKAASQSIETAKKLKEIAKAKSEEFKIKLEKAATLTYLNNLKYQETKTALINNRKILDYNIELATAIFNIDGTRQIDLNRLENHRLELNQSIIENEAEIRNQKVLFNALLNMPAQAEFTLESASFSLDNFFTIESQILSLINFKSSQNELAEKMLNTALIENPTLTKLDQQIEFNKSLINQNKAGYYPELNLSANLNFHDRLKEDLAFSERKSSWSLGGAINLPLYQGGERSKEKSRLNALLNKTEYSKDQIALEIMNEVNRNFNNFVEATQNIAPALKSNDFSSKIIENVLVEYSNGQATLLDLLDVLDNSLNSNLKLIDARYNYYQTMTKLYYSVGINASDDYGNFVDGFHKIVGY